MSVTPFDTPPGSTAMPTLDPMAYAYLQRLLAERTGLVLEAGKEYLVETRLHAIKESEGFSSVSSLLDGLRHEERPSPLQRRVIEAMLNGETSFFRDFYPFEALRNTVLPDLVARRSETRTLHIWSAATSSGQEAYSLAMIVRECLPSLRDWTVDILATDVSDQMLERARSGAYRQIDVNRGLPASYLVKYFDRYGEKWLVKDAIRSMVRFSHLNLIEPWPPLPLFDLILMRNVLLYFSSDTKRTILQSVAKSLRPSGYLMIGGGETSMALDRTFETVRIGKAVSYQLRNARANGRVA